MTGVQTCALPISELKPSPKLGQHTDEVFAQWLKMSNGDIQALREQKIIGNS